MALNKKQAGSQPVLTLRVAATAPTTPASGDPVLLGRLPGVALTDEDTDGKITMDIGPSIFALSVEANDGAADSAIAAGDILYYKVGATPVLNKNSTGVSFGVALEAVTSGETATIDVLVGSIEVGGS